MRVLLCTMPERSHFLQLVPLAWALRTAGHDVRVASPPDFTDTITAAGLTAVPAGASGRLWDLFRRVPDWLSDGPGLAEPYDAVLRGPDEIDQEYLERGYRRQVDRLHKVVNNPLIPDLVAFCRSWEPELVLWEQTTYAGAIAAAACGAAQARVLVGPDVQGYTRQRFLQLQNGASSPSADPLAAWLTSYAQDNGTEFSETLVTGELTVSTTPPALGLDGATPYLPMRFVPYAGPTEIPSWVRGLADVPRVVVTVGLTREAQDLTSDIDVGEVVRSLSAADLEVVVIAGKADRARLTELPDTVRVESFVSLDALLPHCSAIVHHGGYGTVSTAALHAVPQVLLACNDDEPLLAARLESIGAGVRVEVDRAGSEDLLRAVRRAIDDPTVHAGARAVRRQIEAMPSPADVADQLQDWVLAGRADTISHQPLLSLSR